MTGPLRPTATDIHGRGRGRRGGLAAGRALACVLVVLLSSLWGVRRAGAQRESGPIADGRPASVVVAPTSFQVFTPGQPSAAGDAGGAVDAAAFARGATRYAANHPSIFDFVPDAEVADALRARPLYSDRLDVAENWAEAGIDSYKHLETGQAIDELEKAVESYDEIQYHLVNPERVAEVLMYLSLSYLADGSNAARPLVLMKRMIRLDPQRVLRRGYYPDEVVNFYESARNDVLREMQGEGPNIGRARHLADVVDADLVAYGFVLPRESGARVRVWLYSRRKDAFEGPETLRLEAPPDAETLQAAANRLMSRFAGCIHAPPRESSGSTLVDSRGDSPFLVHLHFAYMTWLKYPPPLEAPFGNAGLGLGADLKVTEEFGVGLGVEILNSLRDYNGVLVDDFSTMRVFAGTDIGLSFGRFDFGTRVSVEGTHVGALQLCTDFNDVVTGCRDSSDLRTFEELDFMLGINAEPRIRVRIVEAMYLKAGASISYYFVPFTGRPLGYPLTGVAGFSYRF